MGREPSTRISLVIWKQRVKGTHQYHEGENIASHTWGNGFFTMLTGQLNTLWGRRGGKVLAPVTAKGQMGGMCAWYGGVVDCPGMDLRGIVHQPQG